MNLLQLERVIETRTAELQRLVKIGRKLQTGKRLTRTEETWAKRFLEDGEHGCPKCASGDMNLLYVEHGDGEFEGEHLRCFCNRCQYVWNTKCREESHDE